jgi:hypothetical protein
MAVIAGITAIAITVDKPQREQERPAEAGLFICIGNPSFRDSPNGSARPGMTFEFETAGCGVRQIWHGRRCCGIESKRRG